METEFVEPFRTQNRQLAYALASAGCQFDEDPEHGGPSVNVYTLDFLRTRKIGVGKKLEAAVQEAVDAKIPGLVTFSFLRDDIFNRCIAAWDATVDEFRRANLENRDPDFSILNDISEESMMMLFCIHANNKKGVDSKAWVNVPFCSTVNQTVTEVPIQGKPAPRKVIKGSGKIWPLGASRKMKERMKV